MITTELLSFGVYSDQQVRTMKHRAAVRENGQTLFMTDVCETEVEALKSANTFIDCLREGA